MNISPESPPPPALDIILSKLVRKLNASQANNLANEFSHAVRKHSQRRKIEEKGLEEFDKQLRITYKLARVKSHFDVSFSTVIDFKF